MPHLLFNLHLTIFLSVFLSSCLFGQIDSIPFQTSFHGGVQYGMSWNNVLFSPVVDQGIFQGQRIGLVGRYESNPHLGIQLEAAYDKRGWTETDTSLVTDYIREIEYIELAFFTHISIGKRRIRPIILLGSFLSYPIGQTEIYPTEWMLPEDSYYGKPLPERLQFGLSGGVGCELVFNGFSLQFDGRYRSSLGGIFSAADSTLTFSNAKGFMAQVTSFFKF